jgi:hypothetical protein
MKYERRSWPATKFRSSLVMDILKALGRASRKLNSQMQRGLLRHPNEAKQRIETAASQAEGIIDSSVFRIRNCDFDAATGETVRVEYRELTSSRLCRQGIAGSATK